MKNLNKKKGVGGRSYSLFFYYFFYFSFSRRKRCFTQKNGEIINKETYTQNNLDTLRYYTGWQEIAGMEGSRINQ